MTIKVSRLAIKDIQKIAKPTKTLIKTKISVLSDFPNVTNVKKLKNMYPLYRLRVGDYRILFDIRDNIVYVERIKHRK